ncbi:MAG: FAD-linked oxidase C-terminal domain-containing protein [Pseudomonadota bacterium]
MDAPARKALAQAAGPQNFSTGFDQRLLFASDGSSHPHPPEGVVRAVDTAQISRVLAACSRHGVPVAPRGAGSGLTGGAIPIQGGIVLDMAGLNRIIEISQADQVAVVEPGVVTGDLQAAAERVGLFYPPDPASTGFSTLGGNVAENAGGLRAVKYGVTRDYVMGLKAVLMDGRVFDTGARTIKSVVGYDLTRLLVGSEGTLAVIVQITLRLKPLPEAKATVNAVFARLDDAAQGVAALLASGITPTAIEFMDDATIKIVENYAHIGLPVGAAAMLLVDVDGPPEVVSRQGRDVAELLRRAGGDPVRLARDKAEAEDLWRARRAAGPATYQVGPCKINEDIVVPLGKLPEMVRRLKDIGRQRQVNVISFGHAGDGNIHVNIMCEQTPDQIEKAIQARSDVFAHALALGGSLSGEHGVGLSKQGFVTSETDPVALELMRGLKKVFDPKNLLNPGKMWPPEENA